jgi:hypothetical protein
LRSRYMTATGEGFSPHCALPISRDYSVQALGAPQSEVTRRQHEAANTNKKPATIATRGVWIKLITLSNSFTPMFL